jgi:tRNA(Ile)-lysidine synthase
VCAAEAARPLSAAEAKQLFQPLANASVLVLAVSGGPDSTALLLLAARWSARRRNGKIAPKLLAVTIDHGLRPQSAHEARAVKRLARALGVPHRTLRWQGKKPRTRLQETARAARYRLLEAAARGVQADYILTAHTLDDQAETVLMRLLRGSGITGLAGMREVAPLPVATAARPKRGTLLVRPLLDVPKARLVATLERAGIAYADDAANRDPRFTRARLRGVMPMLAREGLDAPRIALLARRLARAESALERAVDAAAGVSQRASIDLAGTRAFPGKVDTGFPVGNATNIESRALSGHDTYNSRVNLIGKRSWADAAWRSAGPITLDAERFFALPAEIALRLLGRAITHTGHEGSPQLGKLETLYAGLCATAGAGGRLRRTLAGALVTLAAGSLVVERAPPRSNGATGRIIKKKAASLGRRSAAT